MHFADSSERYSELGAGEEDHPEPGEVVFSDETKLVLARRWCWRQSEPSAAVAETRECLVAVEAHHATDRQDIEAALRDLLALFFFAQRYIVRGIVTSGLKGQKGSFL